MLKWKKISQLIKHINKSITFLYFSATIVDLALWFYHGIEKVDRSCSFGCSKMMTLLCELGKKYRMKNGGVIPLKIFIIKLFGVISFFPKSLYICDPWGKRNFSHSFVTGTLFFWSSWHFENRTLYSNTYSKDIQRSSEWISRGYKIFWLSSRYPLDERDPWSCVLLG